MARKKGSEEVVEKILDVDASMHGVITFRDPVNLRINGSFEGKLDTKGHLTVGENAVIQADVNGDKIVVSGKVYGNIFATESLSLRAPAQVEGDIQTPRLSIEDGSTINGIIDMKGTKATTSASEEEILSLQEVARYLEVEAPVLREWAEKQRIPSFLENNTFKFRRAEIDKWVQEEKVKV